MVKLFYKQSTGFLKPKKEVEIPFFEGIVTKSGGGYYLHMAQHRSTLRLTIDSSEKEFLVEELAVRVDVGEKVKLYCKDNESRSGFTLRDEFRIVDGIQVLGAENKVIFQTIFTYDVYFKEIQ